MCNVELRTFNYSLLPSDVQDFHKFSWKILILAVSYLNFESLMLVLQFVFLKCIFFYCLNLNFFIFRRFLKKQQILSTWTHRSFLFQAILKAFSELCRRPILSWLQFNCPDTRDIRSDLLQLKVNTGYFLTKYFLSFGVLQLSSLSTYSVLFQICTIFYRLISGFSTVWTCLRQTCFWYTNANGLDNYWNGPFCVQRRWSALIRCVS